MTTAQRAGASPPPDRGSNGGSTVAATTDGSPPGPEAIRTIALRLAGRQEEVARRIVARYREEIVDYRAGDDSLAADAAGLALDNLEALLANLVRGVPVSNRQLEKTRMGAARRVHQGVSLESFLHAARLWGEVAWDALRGAVREDHPEEREAALEIAGRVMRHVDVASTAGAQAYIDEAQGIAGYGHVLPRDLLEALLGGEREAGTARRGAHSVGLRLAESYVVVLVRPQEVPPRGADGQPLTTRAVVRQMIELARTHLRPAGGGLLVGVRDAEVVAMYPVAEPAQLHTVRQDATALAAAGASSGVCVGMSGWQPGLGGIGLSYGVAREAAQIAAGTGRTGRAMSLDDVLIDHIARFTPRAGRVLDETLQPLVAYDLAHGTALVQTVGAYVDAGFNLTRSAEVLHVHPNTVMYRLRRVGELSGRDPHDPDDLLILFLALKLAELNPAPGGWS